MNDWYFFIEIVTVVFLVIASPVGLWIIREFRTLHKRVDKHAEEMDAHIREGVDVHRALERNAVNMKHLEKAVDRLREETRRHHENGGRHGKQ